MYCKKCGTQNEDNAWKCVKCGEILQGAEPQTVKVSNYLTTAIISAIVCCVPLGIVAIIYASQVNTKLIAGDIEGAKQSSKNAKMWCWITFISGLVVGIVYVLITILTSLAGV